MRLIFLNTNTWNTKQWKFTEGKITRINNDLYVATINHLVGIPVYPFRPHLDIFIENRWGSARPDAQSNLVTYSKTHCLCIIISQSLPMIIFGEEVEQSRTKNQL